MLDVLVHDLHVATGRVSGVLVNNTGHELQSVDLLIRHNWEKKAGQDNSPSEAKLYTVQEQISAGEKVPFTYFSESPLPQRAEGLTSVGVVGYTL
ncbi:MAG: hypothetical protein ACREXR_15370 [Gammaproteobacteria bacterium]